MLLLKSLLVLAFIADSYVRSVVLVITAMGFGMAGFYFYSVYQPYYKPVINRSLSAFFSGYMWACVCLLLLELRGTPQVQEGDGSVEACFVTLCNTLALACRRMWSRSCLSLVHRVRHLLDMASPNLLRLVCKSRAMIHSL